MSRHAGNLTCPWQKLGFFNAAAHLLGQDPGDGKRSKIPPGGRMLQISHLVGRQSFLRLNTSAASSLESEVGLIPFTRTGTSCNASGANTALYFYGGLSGRPRNKKGGADPMTMLI